MNEQTLQYFEQIKLNPHTIPGLDTILRELSISAPTASKDLLSKFPFLRDLTVFYMKAPNFKQLLYTIHLLIFFIVNDIKPSLKSKGELTKKDYIKAVNTIKPAQLKNNLLTIFIKDSIANFAPVVLVDAGWEEIDAIDPDTGNKYTYYKHRNGIESERNPLHTIAFMTAQSRVMEKYEEPGSGKERHITSGAAGAEIRIEHFIKQFGFVIQLGGNYNYNFIFDPKTGKHFTINSKQGIQILNKFINYKEQ